MTQILHKAGVVHSIQIQIQLFTTFIKYHDRDIVYSYQISKDCERIQLVFLMLQWSRYTKILNLVHFWSPKVLIAYKTLKTDHITMSFMDHRVSRKNAFTGMTISHKNKFTFFRSHIVSQSFRYVYNIFM